MMASDFISRIQKSLRANKNKNKNDCRHEKNKRDKSVNGHKISRDAPRSALLPTASTSWTDIMSDKTSVYIDKNAIEYFVRSAKFSGRIFDGMDSDQDSILREFGMINNSGKITVAAALLFGKPNDVVNGSIVRIGEFSDSGELLREDFIELPVIMQPDAVVKTLFEKYVPDSFVYQGTKKKVINRYSQKAIREAVVNAIIHKQYERREPVLITVSPNSIEIYNPGQLPSGWVAEDLVRKHHSIRRNEGMAKVFHEAGFLGLWGRGIGTMCEACRENGNPLPEFTVLFSGLEVLFKANSISSYPDVSLSDSDSCDLSSESESQQNSSGISAGSDVSSSPDPLAKPRLDPHLSNSEAVICRMISEHDRITASEMSSASGLSERHIYRITKDLSERGIIVREGSRKNGSWKLICDIRDKLT